MIQELIIQNFDSHKKTLLEFSPRINTIVGTSNSGKTSILRSLYWAIYNRPLGNSHISFWNKNEKDEPIKSSYVKVKVNNNTIERRKGKVKKIDHPEKFNGYIINDENYLEAIGQDIPEQVSKLFNIDNVNIQKQMDAPFLLSDSAGEVARFFNNTIRLDLIDRILSKVESKKRENNKEKNKTENELFLIEKDIGNYIWLDDAQVLIDKIEKIEERYNNRIEKKETLEEYIEEYENKINIINEFSLILSAEPLVKKVELLLESLNEKREDFDQLVSSFTDWQRQDKIIKGSADFSIINNLIIKINNLQIELNDKNKKFTLLQNNIEDYENNKEDIIKYNKDIKWYEKQLPNTCPLCGNILKEKI